MAIQLALVNGRMRMRDDTTPVHLTSERVAALLEGRLTGVNRERAVSHLAGCDECRQELTELRSVLDTAHQMRSRRWMAAIAAVAAMLAFAILPRLTADRTSDGSAGVTRTEDARFPDGTQVIGVVGPSDRALVSPTRVELTWHQTGAGARYLVSVLDTSGATVWTVSVSDTSVLVPDSARLMTGNRYFWSVDARLANGRTAKTGVFSFTVR
jgi:hypothetical protein